MATWYTLYKKIRWWRQTFEFVIYEVVTSLCSVLYAHGGCKLRLVMIMDQPHLRNPFQIVCGVDLHIHRMTMTSMQMVWKHNVHVADENAWIKKKRKDKAKVKLNCHTGIWMTWFMMTSTWGTQWHTQMHKHTIISIHTVCHPDLLNIFFGPDVRRVYHGAHDLQVAMDNKGLVWPVSVDADSPVVVDWVWQLTTLPEHFVVTFKLAWVGCL